MVEPLKAACRFPNTFLVWWLGELTNLLPTFLRPSASTVQSGLILRFTESEIILTQHNVRSDDVELMRFSNDAEMIGGITASIDAFSDIGGKSYKKLPMIVRFARSLGMRRLIELPLAAKGDLHQLLEFELDRLTPFKAGDVYFSWQIESTDRKAQRMVVAIEMAPKALVDRAVDFVAAHGRDIDRLELDHIDPNAEPINLLPTSEREKTVSLWSRRLFKIVALPLLLVAISVPISWQMMIINKFQAEIATVRVTAEESIVLQAKLTSISDQVTFLTKIRKARPTMTETIAELTRLIPDDSHILDLRIAEGTIDLTGFANRASELLTILDGSPMFEAPRFVSPVTKDQRSDKERFQIAVDLTEKLP